MYKIIGLAALFFVVAIAISAPVPFPKPLKKMPLTVPSLTGRYQAMWAHVVYGLTLNADGSYECDWLGTKYRGSWGIGTDGLLHIRESCSSDFGTSWQHYAISLKWTYNDSICTQDGKVFHWGWCWQGKVETEANNILVRIKRLP